MLRNLTILLSLAVFASCKPHVSLSGATIPPEAKSISVGFFTNHTTLGPPSLSTRFTESLKDMVARQTNLDLIKNNGDLQFEGFIADYSINPVAIQSNDQAALNRMTVSVKVIYFNKYDQTKNFEQTFTRFADYSSSKTLSEEEGRLIQEINRQLTEDIFNTAFNNW